MGSCIANLQFTARMIYWEQSRAGSCIANCHFRRIVLCGRYILHHTYEVEQERGTNSPFRIGCTC